MANKFPIIHFLLVFLPYQLLSILAECIFFTFVFKGGQYLKKKSLKEQANEIIRIAEESGVQSNFFFATTFKRYQTQLEILSELEKIMAEEGMLVSKEYVKGRKNLYSNPAVAEYNKTTDSANKTVATLIRIIKNFNVEESTEEEDVLMKMINGSEED